MVDPLVFGAVDVVVMPDIRACLRMVLATRLEKGRRLVFMGVPVNDMSRDELTALIAYIESQVPTTHLLRGVNS